MTEPTTPVSLEPTPLVDGMPSILPLDTSGAEGLELKARSQWSYARQRFLRHRLAMIGLVGLIIIFGAGALARFGGGGSVP